MQVSCDEFHESRLPSPARSDKCCFFAFFDREREIREDLGIVVAVGEIIDLDVLVFRGKRFSSRVPFHLWSILKCSPKFLYIYKFFGKVFIKLRRVKKKRLKN